MAYRLIKFDSEYGRIMDRIKFFPQFAVLMMIVIAFGELTEKTYFYTYRPAFDVDMFLRLIGLNSLVLAALVIRFIVLLRRASASRGSVVGSWFFVLLALFLYYIDAGIFRFPDKWDFWRIYRDPVEGFFWTYLICSSILVVIVAAISYIRIR